MKNFFKEIVNEMFDGKSNFYILWGFLSLMVFGWLGFLMGEGFGFIVALIPSVIIGNILTRLCLKDLPLSLIYLFGIMAFLFFIMKNI